MFTNPLQPGNQIQNSIDSLMTQVDANKDGVVSTDEFAEFLTTLLEKTGESTGEPGVPEPTVPQPTQPLAPPIGSPGMIWCPSSSMPARMFCSNHCSASTLVRGIVPVALVSCANASFADFSGSCARARSKPSKIDSRPSRT